MDSRFSLSDIEARIERVSLRPNLTGVVYGPPGMGKTTLVSTLPRPLILDTERGRASLRGWRQSKWYDGGQVLPVNSWPEVEEAYYYALNRKNADGTLYFQSVVWDTVTSLHDIAYRWVVWGRREDYSKLITRLAESDTDFRNYGKSARLVEEMVIKFIHLSEQMNVIFTGHERRDGRDDAEAEITLGLPPAARGFVFKNVDIIGYLQGGWEEKTTVVEGKTKRERKWAGQLRLGAGGKHRVKDRISGAYIKDDGLRLPPVVQQPNFRKILKIYRQSIDRSGNIE